MGNQSHPPHVPTPLTADVVVDVASLGYSIGEALHGHRARILVRPDLVELVAALGGRGLGVRSMQLAIPLVPLRGAAARHADRARELVSGWERWFLEQSSNLEERCGLVPLALVGATDGVGDVGIDEVVSWAALEAAEAIAVGGDPSREVVAVVSADSDMWHLSSYTAPTTLFVAGGFRAQRRRGLLGRGLPFVAFGGGALTRMAPGETAPPPSVSLVAAVDAPAVAGAAFPAAPDALVAVEHLEGSDGAVPLVASSPLQPTPLSSRAEAVSEVAGANTVAVVDAYGIFRSTQLAIGAADLPRPEAVRSILGQFGWDSPIATLFVVPDLSSAVSGDAPAAADIQAAWVRRDAELDELALEVDDDGDALTQVRRSELRVGRSSVTHKRLATGIVAELWRASHRSGGAEVVVVTEDRDVCWLLACAPETFRPFPLVTRVGLHPSRVEPLEGVAAVGTSAAQQVVLLTEYLAAQLTGVIDRAFGRSLRDRLADVAGRQISLQVHGVEPETGGVEVTVVSPPEVAGSGAEEAGDGPGAEDDALGVLRTVLHGGDGHVTEQLRTVISELGVTDAVIELHFDHRQTCSAPKVVLRPPDGDGAPAEVREARVVQREGYHLWVDVDFDGVADLGVPTGHDTTTYRTDDAVVLQQAGSSGAPWALRDPGPLPGAPVVEPVLLWVEQRTTGGATATDVETDRRGWLEPMPGKQQVDAERYVFGVEVRSGADGAAEWIAVSTGLRHLDHLVRR